MMLINFKGNRERPFSNWLICFMDRIMKTAIIYHRVHFFIDACPPTPQNASPIAVSRRHKAQNTNHHFVLKHKSIMIHQYYSSS
jgi:hypothetical protein